MSRHVRFTFYVGLARSTDPANLSLATIDARAGAVARYFARAYPSGTFTRADGYWQGVAEPSATFEVIRPDEPTERPKARDVAARLSVLHRQEGVGLAVQPVAFEVIGPDDLPSVFHGRYASQGATLESLDRPAPEPAPWTASDEIAANLGLGDLLAAERGRYAPDPREIGHVTYRTGPASHAADMARTLRDAEGEEAAGRG